MNQQLADTTHLLGKVESKAESKAEKAATGKAGETGA